MNESLDPNEVLSDLGLEPVLDKPTTSVPTQKADPRSVSPALTQDEVLVELGLNPVAEAARNPRPTPPRPAQRAVTPESAIGPERTLEERFGKTEPQRHPNSCVIACLINAKKYIFGVKGLDTAEGVELVEETLRDMATRHGFDESKGINTKGAQKLLEDNRHFAKQTESTEETLDFLDRGFGLIASISFKQKNTGKVIRHALLIHAATDPNTGEKRILVRDTHMQPTDKHPGLQEITRDELIGHLNGTKESWFKITNVLVVGPQGYKPDLSQETSEQRQHREKQVEAEVETLRKKLTQLEPTERAEAKYQLEPADRLRIILETFRPKADFANRKLTKHYNQAWELMYQTELNGSSDGQYGGILGGLKLDLNEITAALRSEAQQSFVLISEQELQANAKGQLTKNIIEAQARLDRLEQRYLSESIYLSEKFAEITIDNNVYAESLRQTSQNDARRARELLSKGEKEEAQSIFWRAEGLAKIARHYDQPHGIDLADSHPYQREKLTNRQIGAWKDLKALKLEYYLSGGAVEAEDVDIEQNIIKMQTDILQKQWPDGATPPEDTLKYAVNQKMGEIAHSGTDIPATVMDAYKELDNMSHAYGDIGKRLGQLASEINDPDNVGDVKNITRIKEFFNLQEKVFELRHETALRMAELGAFLES